MSTQDPFDHYATTYAETVATSVGRIGGSVEYFALRKAQLLREELPQSPSVILDFGCGVGTLTIALAQCFSTPQVVGVDSSTESIRQAQLAKPALHAARVQYCCNDITGLPVASESTDLVVAACVFHHIPEEFRDHWLRELVRVLRPGGTVALFEHNPWNPLTRRAVERCPFDEDAVLLSYREAWSRLSVAGCVDIRVRHYLFVPPALDRLRGIERWMHWLPLGAQYAAIAGKPG